MAHKSSNHPSRNRSQSGEKGSRGGKFFTGEEAPEQARTLAQKFLAFFGFGKAAKAVEKQSRKPAGKKPGGGKKREIQKLPATNERLFVGNLAYSIEEKDLEALFNKVGTVASAEVVKNRQTRRSKGFGFVTMSSLDEAKRAVSELDGEMLDGREISVSGAKSEGRKDGASKSGKREPSSRKREERGGDRKSGASRERGDRKSGGREGGKGKGRGKKASSSPRVVAMPVEEVSSPHLVMSNLSEDFGQSELEHLFAGVAKVAKSEISGGKATIEMASIDDAQSAVRLLNGKDFMGKTLSLTGESPAATAE